MISSNELPPIFFDGTSANGIQLSVSNRFNIFLAPGYAIDKDKLVYLKAGYSSVSLKETMPSTWTYYGSLIGQ